MRMDIHALRITNIHTDGGMNERARERTNTHITHTLTSAHTRLTRRTHARTHTHTHTHSIGGANDTAVMSG